MSVCVNIISYCNMFLWRIQVMNGVSAQHYNCMDGVITFLCIHFLAWAHTAD